MLNKFKLLGVLLAAIILSVSSQAGAETNWNTNMIQATGIGVPNPKFAAYPAQAMAMARTAAIADAQRNLLSAVKGVQIDSETTVENFMTTSDVIVRKVSGLVVGARIVSEGEVPGGGYQVTMEMPMFGGVNSLADTVLERPQIVEPFPAPAPDYRPPVDVRPSYSSGGYTGLIIDCRGLPVINPVMSPVIKNARGQKIYGHQNLDFDRIIVEGMASYAQSMGETSRAGSNPLIVTAIALEDHNANPVLTIEDADLVLYENGISHFLDKTAVVFLY